MTNTDALIGKRVRFSQPGADLEMVGTVKERDPLLDGFVRVLWSDNTGGRTMVATVHASRCEEVDA